MPPSSAAARIPSPEKDIIYAITINETAITAVTEEQSPSIPSVKLAEFTQPYIITTESAQNTMPVNTFLEKSTLPINGKYQTVFFEIQSVAT